MMTALGNYLSPRRGRGLLIAALLGSSLFANAANRATAQTATPPTMLTPPTTSSAPATPPDRYLPVPPPTSSVPAPLTPPTTTMAPNPMSVLSAPSAAANPMSSLAAPPTIADRPLAPGFVVDVTSKTDRIELTVNTSRRLTLAEPFPNVVVNNPEIISVTPISNTEVQVFARKPGVTQMVFETESKKVYTVGVIVLADAAEVNMILKKLYPRANIEVTAFASTATVVGFVDDPTLVTPVMQTVQEFFPTAINSIEVSGGQQVLVRVKIMEVSRTKLRTLGVDFADITASGDFFGSSISGMLRAAALTTPAIQTTGAQTFQFGVVDAGNSFFGFIEALRQHDIAKVLADPEVVAISGRPAYFNEGGEIPILVPQSLGTVSIEYRPYGTQVDFVPIIRSNGTIRLEIRPRVSELDIAHGVTINGTVVPALTSRTVDTGVEMRSGQTLAIAGLVQTRTESTNRGIPYLSDIPYLGVPFRRVREQANEVELLILVTPFLVEAGEMPCTGPGLATQSPTDCQLFGHGQVEVPTVGPQPDLMQLGGAPLLMPGVIAGQNAPMVPVEGMVPNSMPLPPPEVTAPPKADPVPMPPPSAKPASSSSSSLHGRTIQPSGSSAGSKASQTANNRQDRSTSNPSQAGIGAKDMGTPGFIGPVGYDDLK